MALERILHRNGSNAPGRQGVYSGWFSEVNLPGSMTEWFWRFTYADGGNSMGAAPESGRDFLEAALIVPEPGTLVLLISGGLGLLLARRRSRSVAVRSRRGGGG